MNSTNEGFKMYKPGELSKILGVTRESLRNWSNAGKLETHKTEHGHRRYVYKEMEKDKKRSIIYARVSSTKQKEDLSRQIEFM